MLLKAIRKSIFIRFVVYYVIFAIIGLLVINFVSLKGMYDSIIDSHISFIKGYNQSLAKSLTEMNLETFRDVDMVSNVMSGIPQTYVGDLTLMDDDNNIVYSTELNLELLMEEKKNHLSSFNPKDYESEGFVVSNFYDSLNQDYFSVLDPIYSDGHLIGYSITQSKESDILSIARSARLPFLITFTAIMLVSFVAFWGLIPLVYRPLSEISFAATEYSHGNFDYTFEGKKVDKREDELGVAAKSLESMAEQINNASKYRTELISNISHDFRSPITSITGYLQAMIDDVIPPEDYKKYMQIVLNETNRLNKLSAELKELNKWNTTGPELIYEEFDLKAVVNMVIETFDGRCREKNITIATNYPHPTYMVLADKAKIEQVIYNLIDNAIKFSYHDGKIQVKLDRHTDKTFVSIKDYGIGITQDALDKIWLRFYKTDKSRGLDKMGSGIGLAIVREIIQAHGENIDVASTEGVGATFTFSLKNVKDSQ